MVTMERILERLKSNKNRKSTRHNYHQIWKQFNKFLMLLDKKPAIWERRVSLFCAFLIDKGLKSNTIRSYISALKNTLIIDNYEWNDSWVQADTLISACKVLNDRVFCRFLVHIKLLELILFEIARLFDDPYLILLYRTIFAVAYYGMLRMSEVTMDTASEHVMDHALKAANVFIADNKPKIQLILYSSKTHGKESRLQIIKIVSNAVQECKRPRHFCLIQLMRVYFKCRGDYWSEDEQFFIFRHKVPVPPSSIRKVLRDSIVNLGLDHTVYDFHGIHAGRTTDLVEQGVPIEEVQRMGRWKSNAVHKYIKMC